jgi:hypothetical protein
MVASRRKAGRKSGRKAGRNPGRKDGPGLEAALRVVIEETISRRLERVTRGRPLAEELRDLRDSLARLEKRLATLDGKSGGRGRGPARTGSPGRPPLHTGCKVDGCANEHYALGLCSKHYQQQRRTRIERQAKAASRRRRR